MADGHIVRAYHASAPAGRYRLNRVPSGGQRRGGIAPVVSAACVLITMTVVTGCVQPQITRSSNRAPGTPVGPTRIAHGQPALGISPPASARPAACTAGQLVGSVDPVHTGPTGGTEHVVIDLRNVSPRACWLDGVPTIQGILTNGTAVRLNFQPLPTTYARDVAGAGPLLTGGTGRFALSVGINHCTAAASRYATLGIQLPNTDRLEMAYPPQLAATPCLLNITRLGPVTEAG